MLSFSAYTKELAPSGAPTGNNEIGSPPVFTDRGYARVVVCRRGMGRSDGEPGVFFGEDDVDDLVTAIAWIAKQPWCTGDVVMFGTSYFAITQIQAAVRQPPALRAIFANEMCTDFYRHIVAFGGSPAVYFAGMWAGANFTEGQVSLKVTPVARAVGSQVLNSPLKRLWERQVTKRMAALTAGFHEHTPVRAVREQFLNWLVDGKTRELNMIPAGPSAQLDQVIVPYVVVQNLGYFNLHQFGCYDLFDNAGTPPDRRWMILGPAEYELPVYAWQLEALAFFDHILHGVDNGYADQPAVRYWIDGAEHYGTASSFPIPGSEPVRYYLGSGGADPETHCLATGVAPDAGSNSWAAVPLGAPLVGGFDEVANQMLTYETKEVARQTDLAGPVSAHMSFSSNEIDSHVVARLGRIDSAGDYHLLSLGTISPARRRLDTARNTSCEIGIDIDDPQPLTPGEPVQLAFSLTPQPTRLEQGDRLRLDVASRTDILRSDVSHGHVHFDLQVPPYFSRNTLHYGPDTYIEVHAVDVARAQPSTPPPRR